jgi:hypothetical protein
MSSAPRRPRRAVRQSGTVGTDDSVLLTTLPAFPSALAGDPAAAPGDPAAAPGDAAARPGPGDAAARPAPGDAAARPGPGDSAGGPGVRGVPDVSVAPAGGGDSGDLWRATRSADDSDRGWGREEPSSNDERLRREKPPHW